MAPRMSYEDIERSSEKSIEEYLEVYIDVLEPRFSFDDIAGYKEVKERFRDIVVTPLKYGEALKKAGIQPPTGVIVWGPLGTGRGHLIEASAREAGVNYIIIRGRECTAHEEVIRRAFDWAREHKPVLVHLMDLDWLAPRKDASYEWSDGTTRGKPDKLALPQVHRAVHEEIASVAYDEEIFVAASCYRIDVLDQAFTRTSMLGRKIYVPRPSYEDRLAILRHYFSGVTLAEDALLEKLAEETEYYVGWDLESLARKAKLLALQHTSGDGIVVTKEDIRRAMKSVEPWLTPAMARDYDRIRAEDCVHKYNF